MERITQFRSRLLLLSLAALLIFFAVRLYDLQVIETGGKVDNTTTYTTKTRVKAARGEILDRNGNVLVGNRASYDLVINHFVLTSSSNPNQSIYNLVKLCQELGIEYTDRFPITKERPFTYTLEEYNSAWQGISRSFFTAAAAWIPTFPPPCSSKCSGPTTRFPKSGATRRHGWCWASAMS